MNKRLLFIGYCLLITVVCYAQRRTFDQACEIAAAKLSVSATSLQATPVNTNSSSSKSYAADAAAEQPYYILQPSQGEGFVIVSGDERMTPVLAYSKSGTFSPDSLPDNLRAWLQLYATEYEQTVESQESRVKSQGFVGSTEGVEPFLHTTWGQYDPYNRLCPEYKAGSRSATGCGATAMAQCMYYYRYPDCAHGSKSYTTKTKRFNLSWDFDAHPIQWNLMKEDYPASGTSEEEGRAIAELFFGCGVSVNMDYDEESGSQHGTLMASLNQYYGYDDDMAILKRERMSDAAWHTVLIGELEARRPLLTAAWTLSGAGHMFVIHGYQHGDDGTPAYYINWGWRGRYDGYYVMPNLCYDGVAANSLSEDISVIIGLQPDDGLHNRDNTIQIKEITSNKSSINLNSSNLLNLKLSNLYSASLKDFNGEMRVYLVDGNGIKTRIASANVNLRQGLETSINLNSTTVPETVESGTYALQCYAYDITTGTETVVMSHSTTTIAITNTAADYRASVAASHIQVSKTDDRELSLAATNVINTADLPFSGTMQMLVSDYVTGRNITTFGNTLTIEELKKGSYFERTDTYSGTVPSSLADGAYVLHLGARQANYTNWGKGKQYTIEGGEVTNIDIDASTPFWIVDGNVTLEPPISQLTFVVDGTVHSQQDLVMGTPIMEPEPPVREGYTFTGWASAPAVMPAHDVTIEGAYRINKYRVRFVANGVMVSETIQDYATAITAPSAPEVDGYTFSGWGDVPATMPAHDVEVHAILLPKMYHLTLIVNEQTYRVDDVAYGTELGTLEPAEVEGYTFIRWKGVPATMPDHDIEVRAEVTINSYFITFYLPDNVKWGNLQQKYGTPIAFPREPSKNGHTFTGWVDQNGILLDTTTTVPAYDLTYTAQFEVNRYAVRYTVDGEAYHTDSIAYGADVVLIANPVKEGHTFVRWRGAPAVMPACDVEVRAEFTVNSYFITFYLPDDVKWGNLQQKYGTSITPPREPTKKGHTFSGWMDQDGNLLDAATTVPDYDLTYIAQFTPNQYTLTLLVNGVPYKTELVDYGTELLIDDYEDDDYTYRWDKLPATMPDHDVEVNAVVTGIQGQESRVESQESDIYYDLQGHKVTDPVKGNIYIRNKKKVVY